MELQKLMEEIAVYYDAHPERRVCHASMIYCRCFLDAEYLNRAFFYHTTMN